MTIEHRIALEIGKLTIEKCTAEVNLEQANTIIKQIIEIRSDPDKLNNLLDDIEGNL